jgi:hypothetical protein
VVQEVRIIIGMAREVKRAREVCGRNFIFYAEIISLITCTTRGKYQT